jgi:B12-binding domain/radical SAM domain protein
MIILRKGLVLIGYNIPNKYSWAILMGYLEHDLTLSQNINYKVFPFQLYFAPEHETELNQIPFAQYDFVVITYSLLTVQLPQFQDFLIRYPQFFQKFHPNVITVIGGPHGRAKPDYFFPSMCDFLIPGEGEITFQQLLYALAESSCEEVKTSPPKGVYANTQQLVHYKKQTRLDTSTDLVQVGHAPPFSEKYRLFGPFEISRGCPFGCKYCQTGCSYRSMRHAAIEDVVKWIKRGAEIKYDKIWFLTPNAFAYGGKNGTKPNPTALQELLSSVRIIPGVKEIYFGTFPSEVRPEFCTREVLEAVIPYITNRYFVVGAQNASDRLLKQINRGHNFSDVRNALSLLQEFDFAADIDFIFGLPGETKADIDENIAFFEEIDSGKIKNVRIHTHTFMPLPGTPFENEPVGVLHPRINKIIGKLGASGKAFGEHIAQAGLVETRYNKRINSLDPEKE